MPGARAIDESPAARRGRAALRLIKLGLLASLLLALLSAFAGGWGALVAKDRIDDMFRGQQAQAQLMTLVGRDIARIRGAALEEIRDAPTPRGVPSPETRLLAITESFDAKVARLDVLLEAREHDRDKGLRADLANFRASVGRFIEAAEDDDAPRRADALEDLLAYASRLQSTMDTVFSEAVAGTMESMRLMKSEYTHLALVEGAIALMLILGLAAVWLAVLRASRSAMDIVAGHVARTEQANKDLDAFAGRLAHDFRNVLAPLPLVAGRLRRGRNVDVESAATQLERVTRRGARLIDGLLSFSRLGHTSVEFGTAVRVAIADVLDEVDTFVTAAQAHVEVEAEDVDVACAPALVHLVLANIMTNALKYLGDSPTRTVFVHAAAVDGGARITIRDTGPGIPEEHLPYVFDPFYRVPGTEAPGSGLGLPTVKRVIEAIGGTVALESAPGEGTTVTLWLPGASGASPERPAPKRIDGAV